MNYSIQKKYLALLPISILMLSAGCSDDSNMPVGEIPDKTYTSSNGLQLFYNGVEMPGKSIEFLRDGNTATIKGFSTFDLSQLSAFGLSGNIPCPGIVPGSPTTVWNVSLSEGDGVLTFQGEDSNELCSYSYKGSVNADKLVVYIEDAMLNSHPLSSNAWKPAPTQYDTNGLIVSSPVYIDWEFDPLPETDINLSPLLESLTGLPIIPVYGNTSYMSVNEAFKLILQATAFRADGNILFTYISSTGGAAHIAQTQPNGLQYTIPSPGAIDLYVNPLSLFGFILENASTGTPADEVDLTSTGLYPSGVSSATSSSLSSLLKDPMAKAMAKAMLSDILPHLASGIQLNYTIEDNHLNVYVDTATSLSLLRTIIDTYLSNDESLKALISQLGKNPTFAPLLEDLPKLQQTVEEALLNTTKLRIGFAFVPA